MANSNNDKVAFLDYEGLALFKSNSDKLYLPVVISGSLTGNGTSVSTTISNNKIKDSMVPYIRFTSDPSVIADTISITVDTGSVVVSATVNGTVTFTITLTEAQ